MAGTSVLVIDSNSQFRRSLARFLIESDIGDLHVYSAVARIQDFPPLTCSARPQIVLLGLSGDVQAALRSIPLIRSAVPDAPIIVLGILEDTVYQQAALAAGADRFLGKATVSTRLIPVIRQLATLVTASDVHERAPDRDSLARTVS